MYHNDILCNYMQAFDSKYFRLDGEPEMCNELLLFFFFQAEDGIRDAQESRGLGDVYERQVY